MERTAGPAAPVLDEAVLADLADRVGADQLSVFANMFRAQAAELGAAIDAADAAAIGREAHSMVSAAGLLGLSQLMEACRAVLAAERGPPGAMLAASDELKPVIEAALAAVAARFPDAG